MVQQVQAVPNHAGSLTGAVISVAPMMGCTDRHCRYFFRQLAPRVRLYTEMVTAQAVTLGRAHRLLAFDPAEHPVAVQLAGSEPRLLARAAAIAAGYGYDEVNLNVGCPSPRVQAGEFGVCLMRHPERVADCVAAMQAAVAVPVTVKIRLGVDGQDSYEFLADFVAQVAGAGCRTFIVHARKAILQGLSPRNNLQAPPLRYEVVYRLKRDFPQLAIHINGGVNSLEQVALHLEHVDGVMIGRKVYREPWFLTRIQQRFFGTSEPRSDLDRRAVLHRMIAYAQGQVAAGVRLQQVTRHLLGLYTGVPGARRWRRFLAEQAAQSGAGPEVLARSLAVAPV